MAFEAPDLAAVGRAPELNVLVCAASGQQRAIGRKGGTGHRAIVPRDRELVMAAGVDNASFTLLDGSRGVSRGNGQQLAVGGASQPQDRVT